MNKPSLNGKSSAININCLLDVKEKKKFLPSAAPRKKNVTCCGSFFA